MPIQGIDLLKIGLMETSKALPVIGPAFSTIEAVYQKVEAQRVQAALGEILQRLKNLEEELKKDRTVQILVYTAEQVRSDLLAEAKAPAYGIVVANLINHESPQDDVVMILDSLRKLVPEDINVLKKFNLGGKLMENRQIAELAGHTPYTNPFGDQDQLQKGMAIVFPSLMRLQGLGLLFVAKPQSTAGPFPPKIAVLGEYLKDFAHLTPIGQRLVIALS
jgi:anion-transporting  ArsA/GET3 family ATPase